MNVLPELLVRFGSPVSCPDLASERDARTLELEQALAKTQASLAELAIARDPAAFTTLAMGRAGVGGLYDFWRRMTASLRGQKFQDRHQQRTGGTGECHQGRTHMTAVVTSYFRLVNTRSQRIRFRYVSGQPAVLPESPLSCRPRVPAQQKLQPTTYNISVLIPARNEALRIGPLLDSVLASEGVHCDLCVLDDESQDGTDAIVRSLFAATSQCATSHGTSVPCWLERQAVCVLAAGSAGHVRRTRFLDADVALSRDALLRAVSQRRRTSVDLLSGFPQQRVVTIGEQILIPLIHVILLCFLPFGLMRWTRMTGAAAGCGQFFLTTKKAYELSGGHSSIRQSLHDGIMLPRAIASSG